MKILIKLSVIVLAVFALVTQGTVIFISNTQASDSISATGLSAKIETIQEANIDLESKILALSSYDTISSRAAELGYKDTSDFISIYEPQPIALR